MAKMIPHYISSLDEIKNKGEYKRHLKKILKKYRSRIDHPIDDNNDILDLKYFVTHYCDKRDELRNIFDIESCYFVVKFSEEGTSCVYIVNNDDVSISEQISIHNFGNPPKPFDNFKRRFVFIIRSLKEEKRKEVCEKENRNPNEYDLYHNSPKTKDLVLEFLQRKELSTKVEEIISPNGQGNAIPELTEDYKYLDQDILNFYSEKLQNGQIDLRLIKKKIDK